MFLKSTRNPQLRHLRNVLVAVNLRVVLSKLDLKTQLFPNVSRPCVADGCTGQPLWSHGTSLPWWLDTLHPATAPQGKGVSKKLFFLTWVFFLGGSCASSTSAAATSESPICFWITLATWSWNIDSISTWSLAGLASKIASKSWL